MPSNRFFGEGPATLTVETTDGTSITAAKATDVTVTAVADHVEFFTGASVTREEVKRREVAVEVEMTIREFNEELGQHWLQGEADSTSTTINDDAGVKEFKLTVEVNMTDHTNTTGDESLQAVVDGIHFDQMPLIDFVEGEYLETQLSGRGDSVTFTKEAVA